MPIKMVRSKGGAQKLISSARAGKRTPPKTPSRVLKITSGTRPAILAANGVSKVNTDVPKMPRPIRRPAPIMGARIPPMI